MTWFKCKMMSFRALVLAVVTRPIQNLAAVYIKVEDETVSLMVVEGGGGKGIGIWTS